MEIWSESMWALEGCWRLQAGAPLDEAWEHLDLWLDVAHLLRRRDTILRWVKGHLELEQASTEILRQDRWGNAGADTTRTCWPRGRSARSLACCHPGA